MQKIFKICALGLPGVGKSNLLNRIAGRNLFLESDGATSDNTTRSAQLSIDNAKLELVKTKSIDTVGYQIDDETHQLQIEYLEMEYLDEKFKNIKEHVTIIFTRWVPGRNEERRRKDIIDHYCNRIHKRVPYFFIEEEGECNNDGSVRNLREISRLKELIMEKNKLCERKRCFKDF